jgi:hypothetical protein
MGEEGSLSDCNDDVVSKTNKKNIPTSKGRRRQKGGGGFG